MSKSSKVSSKSSKTKCPGFEFSKVGPGSFLDSDGNLYQYRVEINDFSSEATAEDCVAFGRAYSGWLGKNLPGFVGVEFVEVVDSKF